MNKKVGIVIVILSLPIIARFSKKAWQKYQYHQYQELYPEILLQALQNPLLATADQKTIVEMAKKEKKEKDKLAKKEKKANKNKSKEPVFEEPEDDFRDEHILGKNVYEFGEFKTDEYNQSYNAVDGFIYNNQLHLVLKDRYYKDYLIINTENGEKVAEFEERPYCYTTQDLKHFAYIVEENEQDTLYVDFNEVLKEDIIYYFEFINNKGDWGCLAKKHDSWDYHHLYLNGKVVVETDAAIRSNFFNPDGKKYCYKLEDDGGPLEGFYFEKSKAFKDADDVKFTVDGKETLVSYSRDWNAYVYTRSNGKTYGPYNRVKEIITGKTANDWAFVFYKDHEEYVNYHGKEYGPYYKVFNLHYDRELNHVYYEVFCTSESGEHFTEIYKDGEKITEVLESTFSPKLVHSEDYSLIAVMDKDDNGVPSCDLYKDGVKNSVDLKKVLIRTACISPDRKYIYFYGDKKMIRRLDTDTLVQEDYCELSEDALKSEIRHMHFFENAIVFDGFVIVDGVLHKGDDVSDNLLIYNNEKENNFVYIQR